MQKEKCRFQLEKVSENATEEKETLEAEKKEVLEKLLAIAESTKIR